MKKTRQLLSILLTMCLLMTTLPLTALADTIPSDWAAPEVALAENVNLVTDKVKEDYQKEITREEFCELVVRLYAAITGNTPNAVNTNFIDVDNNEVSKAYGLGIVYGVTDTEFVPDAYITRQEICAMLVRCIDKAIPDADVNNYPTITEIGNEYADAFQVSDWAQPNVFYAIDNDIMKGVYAGLWNNLICPQENTTREQAVLMNWRVYDNRDNLGNTSITSGTKTVEMNDDAVESVTVDYLLNSPSGEIEIEEMSDADSLSETEGKIGLPVNISLENGKLTEATIQFHYNRDALKNINEDDLSIAWYDAANQKMVLLESDVDTDACKVMATTTHFSEYILIDKRAWYAAWRKEQAEIRDHSDEALFDIVFAVDASGSMVDNDPNSDRKTAVYNFVEELYPNDSFAVISFDGEVKQITDFTYVNAIKDISKVKSAIQAIRDDGNNGTNIHRAINASVKLLENDANTKSQKMIILLTDGEHNGSAGSWFGMTKESEFDYSSVEEAKKNNIKIYTIALGDEVTSDLLQEIADKTGGKHYKSKSDGVIDTYKQIKNESIGYSSDDIDGDGIPDAIETAGMRNQFGQIIKTNPNKKDSDEDGLSDGDEMGKITENPITIINPDTKIAETRKYYKMKSNPNKVDTDIDGLDDAKDPYPMLSNIYLVHDDSIVCSHNVTENRAKDAVFSSNDEYTHTETVSYETVCVSCNKVVNENASSSKKIRVHAFDKENKCVYCGFETMNPSLITLNAEVNYKQNDINTHKKIYTYLYDSNKGQEEEILETHKFNADGKCEECGYSRNKQSMEEAFSHEYNVNGSVMYKNKPYQIIVPQFEHETNKQVNEGWKTVETVNRLLVNFNWINFLKDTSKMESNLKKIEKNENSLATTMAWISLFNNIATSFDNVKISIELQEKGSERRAIIKSTAGIFNSSLYGKTTVLSEELNKTSDIKVGIENEEGEMEYADIGVTTDMFASAPYGKRVANSWVRRNFSHLPYRSDRQYDLTVSLDKHHAIDNENPSENKYYEPYASYIAYDEAGNLRVYPIWLENDDIFIHETDNPDRGMLNIKHYMIEHMSLPLGEKEQKILTDYLF